MSPGEVYGIAVAHGERYLLPRRFRVGGAEVDAQYAACAELVRSGHARWLSFASTMAPGIRLTDKPLEEKPAGVLPAG